MVMDGVGACLRSPLGYGLGATTLAATKFGGDGMCMELDLANSFTSLGLPGGLLYGFLVCSVIMMAVRYWIQVRSPIALLLLATLSVTLGEWLNGGQYAVSALVWFCVGALDRLNREKLP
jgi:hypothetical protein